jgi:hypothetical protein
MHVEFAEQYNIPCVVLDGTESPEEAVWAVHDAEATYWDGEDNLCCVRLPDRSQELYTEDALRRSLGKSG